MTTVDQVNNYAKEEGHHQTQATIKHLVEKENTIVAKGCFPHGSSVECNFVNPPNANEINNNQIEPSTNVGMICTLLYPLKILFFFLTLTSNNLKMQNVFVCRVALSFFLDNTWQSMDRIGLKGGVEVVVLFGAYHFTMQSKATNVMPHQTQ